MAHSSSSVHDKYIHFDVESLRPYSEIIDKLLEGNLIERTGT